MRARTKLDLSEYARERGEIVMALRTWENIRLDIAHCRCHRHCWIAPPTPAKPKRFHGTELLDTARVGWDASRIAEEVISYLSGLVGACVRVTIEVEADNPDGASDQIVRILTENSRTLKFLDHGFEKN